MYSVVTNYETIGTYIICMKYKVVFIDYSILQPLKRLQRQQTTQENHDISLNAFELRHHSDQEVQIG